MEIFNRKGLSKFQIADGFRFNLRFASMDKFSVKRFKAASGLMKVRHLSKFSV